MPRSAKQVFDVAEAQGAPEIELDCLLDNLRQEPVAGIADFLHLPDYRATR